MEPQLVRSGIEWPNSGRPPYYITPFGFKDEFGKDGRRLARMCVVTKATSNVEEVTANAFKDVEEVATFGRPVRYLSKEEALDTVAAALQRSRKQLTNANATLMFQHGEITQSRAYPCWQVTIGDRTVYVDQLGKLYGTFRSGRPGN
jgi:hypothetical protein